MKKGSAKSAGIVTVFGSSRIEENSPRYQKAVLIGRMIAAAGFTVCNGGYGGIMEASARGAKEAGGKTIGITASEFDGKANRWIDQERKVPTWRDRLFRLLETGSRYVFFDGGTGTLAELFVAWEMINKKMFKKPMIVYGSWLQSLIDQFQGTEVLFHEHLKMAKTPEAILEYLK